jgi:glycosyltransferase involved in cell wall biosynthesis
VRQISKTVRDNVEIDRPRIIDIVMWVRNGFPILNHSLKRIEEVIPSEYVNNRIMVDDGSSDDSAEVGRSFGWSVFKNEGRGVSLAANTALKQVKTELFASFEADLLLSDKWFQEVPKMIKGNVVVASGIRLIENPSSIKKLYEYEIKKRKHDDSGFFYGRSIDNTVYRTDIIKSMGGFPILPTTFGQDVVLATELLRRGFVWKVNYSVISVHFRRGLADELRHVYGSGRMADSIGLIVSGRTQSLAYFLLKLLLSPLRGFEVAIKKLDPRIIYTYPLLRYSYLKGIIESRREARAHLRS